MSHPDLKNRLTELAGQYSLEVKPIPQGFEIELAEGSETFEVWDEEKEFVLMADNWHQHFDSIDSLSDLVSDLLKGEAWVVLKQTGHLLGGYKIVRKEGGSEKVVRETGMENEPTMRPKRFVKIDYTGGKRASHRME